MFCLNIILEKRDDLNIIYDLYFSATRKLKLPKDSTM